MKDGRWRRLGRGRILAAAVTVSCVSLDPAGPAVPSIDGTYATTLVVSYSNYLEGRTDTLAGTVQLKNTYYRGSFSGTYRLAGDSGGIGGALRPEGTLTITEWGASPTPMADVGALQQLYPWCDFASLGAPPLTGRLAGDTLEVDGGASVPCFYHVFGRIFTIGTELQLHLAGVR